MGGGGVGLSSGFRAFESQVLKEPGGCTSLLPVVPCTQPVCSSVHVGERPLRAHVPRVVYGTMI